MLKINILKEADNQTKLWLADNGKKLKEKILKKISEVSDFDLLVLDFKEIEVTDTSFAREAFVKLIFEIGLNAQHPQILLINVDEYVRQNLHLSFKDHSLFSLIKNQSNIINLIGKFSEQNMETIKALKNRKTASAKQIAADLGGMGLSSSINRLNQLYKFCACTRKEVSQQTGGKEYLFTLET